MRVGDAAIGSLAVLVPVDAGRWPAMLAARLQLPAPDSCFPHPLNSPQALAAARKGGRSGDADLPSREPLYERRAKFDSVRARQQVRSVWH